ncbi:tyrosine-type recombinase/integrase [Kocuria massiliensis]|uniref:tyrosine-type recombinase/integrase n=1 Tax=Kocuria massiliensis TaxID=1926282 RepID=UPI0022B9866E|nr:tyrosine-type recombinase/integrase [Kocuria massiliensis]
MGKRISLLLGSGYTEHQLRLRYVTAAYAATRDLRAVQELLGHADVSTTQTYMGVDEVQLVNAVGVLPVHAFGANP